MQKEHPSSVERYRRRFSVGEVSSFLVLSSCTYADRADIEQLLQETLRFAVRELAIDVLLHFVKREFS